MVYWIASIHKIFAKCSLLGCRVWHDSRLKESLLMLRKGLIRGC